MIRVRDMPKIRDELVTQERKQPQDTDPIVSDMFLRSLGKASLWWVSQDMTTLVAESFLDMPAWSPSIAAPEREGLIVWVGDPYTFGFPESGRPECFFTSADRKAVTPEEYGMKSYRFPLRAVFWQMSQHLCRVTAFTDSVYAIHPTGQLAEFATFDFRANVPFDQALLGHKLAPARIVQILGASWLLMQQPTVADTTRVTPRTGRRKHQAEAKPTVNDVQIIDLRRLAAKRGEDTSRGDGREYHVRWMVRGHWRQQACGPGRRFRKPVFIPPHIRGPEGAPLKTERVNVWRR